MRCVNFTFTDPDQGRNYECQATFAYRPAVRGTPIDPPEAAFVEDVSVEVNLIRIKCGCELPIILSETDRKIVGDWLYEENREEIDGQILTLFEESRKEAA